MSPFNHLPFEQQLLEWSTRAVFAATLVWLAAAAGALTLRRSSAAVRHRVWALATAAALCLPAIVHLFPAIPLGLFKSVAVSGMAAPVGSLSTAQRQTPGKLGLGPRDADPSRSPELLDLNAQDAKGADRVAVSGEASPVRETAVPQAAGARRDARGSWLWLACWAIPALISLGGMVRATRLARRLIAQSHVVEDQAAQDLLRRLVAAGQGTTIALRESDAVHAPICAGVRRPCILLPRGWRSWRPERLEAVLIHEAAHAMRRDVLWQLVARWACAVYWFHPLSWLAASRMRVEREAACDDWALRSGRPSRQYASILVDVAAELNQTRWAPPQAAVAMASRHPLERRVQAILSADRCRNPITRRGARWLTAMTALAIVAAGVLSPFTGSTAEDRTSSAEPQAEGAKQAESKAADAGQAEKATAAVKTVGTTNVEGRVLDESGQGVAGAQVELLFPPRQRLVTVSRDDGSFALGFVRRRNGGFAIRAVASGGSLQGYRQIEGGSEIPEVIELVMRPARQLAATVVDGGGNPVPQASVVGVESPFFSNATTDDAGQATLVVPADARLDSVLAFKPHVGFDYFLYRQPYDLASDPYKLAPENHGPMTFVLNGARSVTVQVLDDRNEPLPRELVRPFKFEKDNKGGSVGAGLEGILTATDDQGLARFDMVPADNISPITFFTLWDGPYFSPERWMVNPGDGPAEITARLVPRVPVTGRVTYADGRPAAGAEVQVNGQGHHIDSFNDTVHVQDDGTFELLVNPDEYYMFAARIDNLNSDARSIAIRQGHPVSGMELVVRQATRIHGRVTVGDESRPMPGLNVLLTLAPEIEHEDLPPEEQIPAPATGARLLYPQIARHTKTNDKGEFEFYGRHGRYRLRAKGSIGADGYVEGHTGPFVVTGEEETNVDLRVEPRTMPFQGRVVHQNDPKRGMGEARIFGHPVEGNSGLTFRAIAGANGEFSAKRSPLRMNVDAQSLDKTLAGRAEVKAGDALLEIAIGPAASLTGRIVERDTGEALAHRQVNFGPVSREEEGGFIGSWANMGAVTTDAEGRFKIEGLAPAVEYGLWITDNDFGGDLVVTVAPNAPLVTLGDIKASQLKRNPE